jgi:hypothetical protein
MLDFDTGKDLTEANEDAGVIVGDERLDLALVPYEKAVHDLLKSASEERYKSMVQMRGRLCSFKCTVVAALPSSRMDKMRVKLSHAVFLSLVSNFSMMHYSEWPVSRFLGVCDSCQKRRPLGFCRMTFLPQWTAMKALWMSHSLFAVTQTLKFGHLV